MSKIFCILFLCLFTVSGVFAQGKGAVSFFCEVDTAFRQVHVGNEVQLCYLSNRKMEKHTPPVWEAGEVERVSGPHAMTSSRMGTVNGNSEVVSLQGTPLYNPPLFCLGIVGIPFLLGALFAYTQYRKLFFRKVETNLSIDELYDLIQKLGAANDWYSEHVGNDCFVGHTSRGFLGSSWGEQIFVVFDKGQVWINSICDLQQRAAITSFGRTKKNIRLLEEAIAEAETEKRKTKQN